MSQIVPGGVSPMMAVLGGDPIDELGRIERSLRFRASASACAARTQVAGSSQRITLFGWCRPIDLATENYFFSSGNSSSNEDWLRYNGTDQTFMFQFAGVNTFTSTRKIRDPLAFGLWMLSLDTTQVAASQRCRFYWNFDEIVFSGSVALNYAFTGWNASGQPLNINRRSSNGSSYGNQQQAFVGLVDGKQLTPSSVAVIHPLTRQVRPLGKSAIRANVAAGGGARNGWGVNGGFYPFDDATSTTTLGYDRSQSDTDTTGNNLTLTGISLTAGTTYDSLLDTPTTNYCTWNPLEFPGASNLIAPLSNGNLRATDAGSGSTNSGAIGTLRVPADKGPWKFEVEANNGYMTIGVVHSGFADPRQADGVGYYGTAGQIVVNGAIVATVATYGAGDVIGVEFDGANVNFFKNSTLVRTQPYTPKGQVTAAVNLQNVTGGVADLNAGQRAYRTTSFSASAKSLCAKNLPCPTGAARNPATAFVGVLGSSANILTNLATARAGWADYIDIVKRRDSGEGWRLSFSDDPGQAMDWQSSGGKFAYPALAGSSYVAYSLRVGAAYGVATGRFVHPGGTSVIADGLGKTRKAVILTNEAGSAWYFYHPELTAGKLLYLSSTVAETPDTAINSVTSSGFSITVAAGTWRWIALAETDWLKLFKYVSNNVADGPFDNRGIAPIFGLFRQKVNTDSFWVIDAIRESGNPRKASLFTNLSSGEDTSQDRLDYTSAGPKIRASAGSNPNVGTTDYIGIYIADAVFRYSNAR